MTNKQYNLLKHLQNNIDIISDPKTDIIIRIGDKDYDLKDIVCLTHPGTLSPKIVFIAENESR